MSAVYQQETDYFLILVTQILFVMILSGLIMTNEIFMSITRNCHVRYDVLQESRNIQLLIREVFSDFRFYTPIS